MKRWLASTLAVGILALATPLVASADGGSTAFNADSSANPPDVLLPLGADSSTASTDSSVWTRPTGTSGHWTELYTDGGANQPGYDASGGNWMPGDY
jgi:hypothetical protein